VRRRWFEIFLTYHIDLYQYIMAIAVETELESEKGARRPASWSRAERWRRCGAEGLGVFAIVFTAGGASITNRLSGGQMGPVGAALVSGLTVMAMIYALGHVCGAHFNPAVTLAFTLARHFPWREAPGYIVAQLSGAILAALTLKGLFSEVASLGVTVPAGSAGQSLVLEGIVTFFLMFVIMAVATDSRAVGQSAAIAIGVIITVDILVAGPVSGASMNPARSFGPALISGAWQDSWVYWLGPIAGAILGAIVYQLVRGEGSFKHERQ
jgi:MIP family channel proteins